MGRPLVPLELTTEEQTLLVLDNYGTHKTARIERWLAARPRFYIHSRRPARPG